MTGSAKKFRVLSLDEATKLTPAGRRMARKLGWLLPMAGADGEGEGGEGEGEGAPAGGSGEGGAGDGGAGGEGGGSGDEEDDDDDVLEIKRADYERLRRIAREKDRDEKKREKEAKDAEQARKRKEGEFDALVSEKDEEISAAQAERDEAKLELDAFKRRVRLQGIAQRLGFKDVNDANIHTLPDDEVADEAAAERALKNLAKKKPYLVEKPGSSGAPIGGEGGTTLTAEDIKKMTPEQINARWDEVQKVMSASG